MFENIEGMQCFKRYFPNKPWFYFHDVLEFRWYQEFDYEEWHDRRYVNLTMASEDRQDIVSFTFSDCEMLGSVCIDGWISGLDIINRTQDLQRRAYEIIDFEEGSIHMMCTDFSIKVLQVDGKNMSDDN